MHRHGYQGQKFGRQRDQRQALVQGLAEALIQHESIETTLPKAKAVQPFVEQLITTAKKGDLHARRQIISSLQTTASAHKLVDEIAPKLKDRQSGYLRVARSHTRRGDNAQLARVSFVDDLAKLPTTQAKTPRSLTPVKVLPKSTRSGATSRSRASKASDKKA